MDYFDKKFSIMDLCLFIVYKDSGGLAEHTILRLAAHDVFAGEAPLGHPVEAVPLAGWVAGAGSSGVVPCVVGARARISLLLSFAVRLAVSLCQL